MFLDDGAEVGALAFIVLQSQTDASEVVADVLAEATGARLPTEQGERRLRMLTMATRRIRHHAHDGPAEPMLPEAGEPPAAFALRLAMLGVSRTDRLVLALQRVAALDVDAIAFVVGTSQTAAREQLNDARNRVQALAGGWSSDATSIDGGIVDLSDRANSTGVPARLPVGEVRFDQLLADHLGRESARYHARITPADIEAARGRGRRSRRLRFVATSAVVTLIAAVAIVISTALGASAPGTTANLLSRSLGGPSEPQSSSTPLADPGPIGLVDCEIEPADSSLAYAGWATLDVLHVEGGNAAPGSPVYAVVTRGLAEWVGWRSSGGAMYPPPIGRMGCMYDPSTRSTSIIGVPMDWQPPTTQAGCPVSPVSQIGAYREAGGPHGWLVLPPSSAAWYVGTEYRYLISFRLSPPPRSGKGVSVWAQRIDSGAPIPGTVVTDARIQHPAAGSPATAQPSRFYVTNLGFPTAGCWVVDMAIGGKVVGSTVLVIGDIRASPRPIPILP